MLGVFISYQDLSKRQISNTQLILSLVLVCVSNLWLGVFFNFYAFFVFLFLGFWVWKLGAIGAADVKLAAILSLGVNDALLFAFVVSVLGALLGLVVWLKQKILRKKLVDIAYGVAIFWGFLFLYVQNVFKVINE